MDTMESLAALICSLKNVPNLQEGQRLVHDGFLDSFEILQVAQHIEETFGVQFEDDGLNLDVFDTVESLAQFVDASAPVREER